jgi:hypothetical protein
MNLSQLRKLVEETKDLPDNTVLLLRERGSTFEEVLSIRREDVLAFQRPRSKCPLGKIFHAKGRAEGFGFSEDELAAHARMETVLVVE